MCKINMFHKILFYFRSIYLDTFLKRKYLCSIKYIDEKNKELIYLCRGKTMLVSISFDKMVERYDLIKNFMPDESALIGYYFGLHYLNCHGRLDCNINSFDFTKIDNPGEFIINMIDRSKNLIIARRNTTETFTLSPLALFLDKEILKKFHSIQSCYIGILAGIARDRSKKTDLTNKISNNIISIPNKSNEL